MNGKQRSNFLCSWNWVDMPSYSYTSIVTSIFIVILAISKFKVKMKIFKSQETYLKSIPNFNSIVYDLTNIKQWYMDNTWLHNVEIFLHTTIKMLITKRIGRSLHTYLRLICDVPIDKIQLIYNFNIEFLCILINFNELKIFTKFQSTLLKASWPRVEIVYYMVVV